VSILDNFANKFSSLKKQIPKIIAQPPENEEPQTANQQIQKRKRAQARNATTTKGSVV